MTEPRDALLITGFGPFPGVLRNPSAALARRVGALASRRIAGRSVRILILRTAYAAIPEMLEPALAEAPAAILMLGVASRATRVRVEGQARNRTSRLFPDAAGRVSARLTLEPEGPAARRTAHGPQALAILRRAGIPAAASRDAGRYLCNASYFRVLREGCPVLFLHIPMPARTRRPAASIGPRGSKPEEALARACAEVARHLLARARRQP